MLEDQFSKTSNSFLQYKERVSNLGNEFEFGLFFFLIRKNIIWIILFFIVSLTAAYIYLRYTPEIFESKTVLQISSENEASKILNVKSINEGQNDIAKSIELLRSKVFFVKALSTLPLQITYFAEGTFRSNEHYKLSAYSSDVEVLSPIIYGKKIYIIFYDKNKGEINYSIGNKVHVYKFFSGKLFSTPEISITITINNFSEIEKQQNLVKENRFYFIVNNFDQLANEYFSRLTIRLLNDAARTIEISFKDNNAQKTADVVTTIATEFISYDIEKKEKSSKKILSFLIDQMNVVYERLRNAETSIYTFKKDNKVTDLKNVGDINSSRLATLEDELISIELRQNVLSEIEKNITDKKDLDSYNLISLLTGVEFENALSNQVNNLQELLKVKEELLYEVTPTSEKIKSVEFQIGVYKKLLIESMRSVKNKLQIRKENLEKK